MQCWGFTRPPDDIQTTASYEKRVIYMSSSVDEFNINFSQAKGLDRQVIREFSLNLPMSYIGRLNVQNAKRNVNDLARSLEFAVARDKIPARIAIASNVRAVYDVMIWPSPGATFSKIPINAMFWTNTKSRNDAVYWSREMNGWRAWPRRGSDKFIGLARFADEVAPNNEGQSWLAVSTRATSADGSLLCRWVPQTELMSLYVSGPKLPADILANYPAAKWDNKKRRFDINPELLRLILRLSPEGIAT
jgi:hypothetical protein